jgi:hypothetical protein
MDIPDVAYGKTPHLRTGLLLTMRRTKTQKPPVPNAFASKLMPSGAESFNIKNDAW